MAQAGDGPVGHHLPVEVLERRSLDLGPPRKTAPRCGEPPLHAAIAAMCAKEKSATDGQVDQQRARQSPAARNGSAATARR